MSLQFNPFTGTFDVTTKGDTGNVSAAGDGTAAAPGITFASENIGLFRPGASTLGLSTGGLERLRITSTGQLSHIGAGSSGSPAVSFSGSAASNSLVVDSSSRVGVGTASPTNPLHVSNTAGTSAIFERTGSNGVFVGLKDGSGNVAYLGNTNGAFSIQTAGSGYSDKLVVTSAGLVGIGTSAPQTNLDCRGSILTTNGTTRWGLIGTDADGAYLGTAGINHPWIFKVGNGSADVERMRLTSTGLGIGTTSPTYRVHASGTTSIIKGDSAGASSTAPSLDLYDSTHLVDVILTPASGTGIVGTYSTHPFTFYTNNQPRATIDTSGRLLVGTSSATSYGSFSPHSIESTTFENYTLSIKSNSATANTLNSANLILSRSGGNAVGSMTTVASGSRLGSLFFAGADGTNLEFAAAIEAFVDGTPGADDMPGRLVFSTTADGAASPTERMRINAAGGFKFSDTGTYTSATDAKAEFRQSTNVEGLSVRSTNASLTTSVLLVRADRDASAGEYNLITAGVTAVANRFLVLNSGNVQNTNNSYGAISDIKLKENIVDATSQWSDIKALQVRKYNFKEGQTHTQIGLVAQEVELVSPGLVSESPDRDEDGNDLGTTTKSVNYSVLYMKAVKALQEAMERIETLEAKVAALESV